MQGILNWKKCKRCEKDFDVATNYDECPKCRGVKVPEKAKMEDVFG